MSYDEERAYERLLLEHKVKEVVSDRIILIFLMLYDYEISYSNVKTIRTALEHSLMFNQIKLIKE